MSDERLVLSFFWKCAELADDGSDAEAEIVAALDAFHRVLARIESLEKENERRRAKILDALDVAYGYYGRADHDSDADKLRIIGEVLDQSLEHQSGE